MLYVNLPYACFGLIVGPKGIIIDAPPIASWCIGKHETYVTNYYIKKGGKIERKDNL